MKQRTVLQVLFRNIAMGSVKELRARGGFELAICWNQGVLQSATLKSVTGAACKVRCGNQTASLQLKLGQEIHMNGKLQTL